MGRSVGLARRRGARQCGADPRHLRRVRGSAAPTGRVARRMADEYEEAASALAAAKAYLRRGAPFLGDSPFQSKAVVKAAGAFWSNEARSWAAPCEATIGALLQTGAWRPRGLTSLSISLLVEAREQLDAEREERDVTAQREAAAAWRTARAALDGERYSSLYTCGDCGQDVSAAAQFMECRCTVAGRGCYVTCEECTGPLRVCGGDVPPYICAECRAVGQRRQRLA